MTVRCIVFLLCLLGAANVPAQISADSVRAVIEREVAQLRSKSIVVGIISSDGRQVISAGYSNEQQTGKPDGNTIYEIGSVTKVFTALLLADRCLSGELNLKSPVAQYLPAELTLPMVNGRQITLWSLATHRSGLPRVPSNSDPANLDDPFADYTEKQLYDYLAHVQPLWEAGARFLYSNTGYGLLGHLLSRYTGQNFETLVKMGISKPLGMTRTMVTVDGKLNAYIAQGHTEYGGIAHSWHLPVLAGTGALHSTVNDLLTFLAANLDLKQSLLYPAMQWCQIKQAVKEGNDGFVTLGWTLQNESVYWKDGGTGGYRSFIGFDTARQTGIVILSNSDNPVKDIGLHFLIPSLPVTPYHYTWQLLDTLRKVVQQEGAEAVVNRYQILKEQYSKTYTFNEAQLNYLGHELRRKGRTADAIRIFSFNLTQYPNSITAHESLAEMYKRNGRTAEALVLYKKLATLDAGNPHWLWMAGKLEK